MLAKLSRWVDRGVVQVTESDPDNEGQPRHHMFRRARMVVPHRQRSLSVTERTKTLSRPTLRWFGRVASTPPQHPMHAVSWSIEHGPLDGNCKPEVLPNQAATRPESGYPFSLRRVVTSLMMSLFLGPLLSSCFKGAVFPEGNSTPLISAIISGNVGEAKRLIQSGVNLNLGRENFFDPLLWSIGHKKDDITRLLVAHGADVNSVGPDGTNPLARAAKVGNPEIVRLLIEAGASVALPDAMAADPLICSVGNYEAMKILIDSGADVNTYRIQGGTPLDVAARMSDHASVLLLLENGADPNRLPGRRAERPTSCLRPDPEFHPAWNTRKWHPNHHMNSVLAHWLDWTFTKGKEQPWRRKVVRSLLDAGAKVGLDSMAVAARTGDIEMLKLLFSISGDANMENRHGGTVLHAVYHGIVDSCRILEGADKTVSFLLKFGADPNRVGALEYFGPCGSATIGPPQSCGKIAVCKPLTQYFTPLMRLATRYTGPKTPERYLMHAKLLLDAGADPDLADPRGTNALMLAAWYGYVDLIKLLLEREADPRQTDKLGRNALLYAAESPVLGHNDSLKYLLGIGFDPNVADTNGNTSLMWVASAGNTKVLNFLLNFGASPSAANNFGQTALMFSARHMKAEAFILLHKAGANLHAKDSDGNDFRHYLIPLCGNLKQRGCSRTTPVREYVKNLGLNIEAPLSEKGRR